MLGLRSSIAVVFLVRFGVGALFLLSGLAKLRQPHDFLADLYDYQIVGPPIGRCIAMTMPHVEIVCGVCLLGGICVGGSLLGALALGIVWIGAQTMVLLRGLTVKCGCFGAASDANVSAMTLMRTSAIVVLVGWLTFVVLCAPKARLRGQGAPSPSC